MKGAIPLRDNLPVSDDPVAGGRFARWTNAWAEWLNAVARALVWNLSLTGTKIHNFASIPAHTEDTTTVTVTGARSSGTPTVMVTPDSNTAGIVYKGIVTADNTVTVYALNTTASAIDPASTTLRVLVLQP